MQINKIDSAPAFGAKLKLSGVNKKHWNLNSEEIKQLAYKAEEIGTSKDVVSFKIGKFGTFDNTEKMFADDRNNIEGPLRGSYRDIRSSLTIGGKSQQIQLADYIESNSDMLKHPFKIMKNWLSTLAEHFPNEVHAEHKVQETEKLKNFIDAYDNNAQNVSDYLFAGKDTKKIVKHIEEVKSIKEASKAHMIDFETLDKNYSKKSEDILLNGRILTFAYIKDLISRAHFLSAEKYLEIRKNPAEYANLQAKEEALLKMFQE